MPFILEITSNIFQFGKFIVLNVQVADKFILDGALVALRRLHALGFPRVILLLIWILQSQQIWIEPAFIDVSEHELALWVRLREVFDTGFFLGRFDDRGLYLVLDPIPDYKLWFYASFCFLFDYLVLVDQIFGFIDSVDSDGEGLSLDAASGRESEILDFFWDGALNRQQITWAYSSIQS